MRAPGGTPNGIERSRGALQTLTDEALVVVLVSGVIGALEGELSVRRGMRLRPGHPAVRACPGTFVPADWPDDEIESAPERWWQERAKSRNRTSVIPKRARGKGDEVGIRWIAEEV